MPLRHRTPGWGRLPTLVLVAMCAWSVPVGAQPKKTDSTAKAPDPAKDTKADAKESKQKKAKNFDFNALDLNGRMRTPQLLYFLERANEELERASLEKRSFIPHMVRSVEEEKL